MIAILTMDFADFVSLCRSLGRKQAQQSRRKFELLTMDDGSPLFAKYEINPYVQSAVDSHWLLIGYSPQA